MLSATFTLGFLVCFTSVILADFILVKPKDKSHSGARALDITAIILEGTVSRDGVDVLWTGPLANSASGEMKLITERLCGKMNAQLNKIENLEQALLLCVVQPIEGREDKARTVIYLKKALALNPDSVKTTLMSSPAMDGKETKYTNSLSVFVQNHTVFTAVTSEWKHSHSMGDFHETVHSPHEHEDIHEHYHAPPPPHVHHKTLSDILRVPPAQPAHHHYEDVHVDNHHETGHHTDEDEMHEGQHHEGAHKPPSIKQNCTLNNTESECLEIRTSDCENGACDHHEEEEEHFDHH